MEQGRSLLCRCIAWERCIRHCLPVAVSQWQSPSGTTVVTRHAVLVDGRYEDFWRWKTQGVWFSAFVLRGSDCFFCVVLTVSFAWF